MQIGNFLQYDNVDALGNTLTYSDPCKFNAKFKGSNCFYSDTTKNYISLGPRTQFEDVEAIEFTIIFDGPNSFANDFVIPSIPALVIE